MNLYIISVSNPLVVGSMLEGSAPSKTCLGKGKAVYFVCGKMDTLLDFLNSSM